MTVKLWVMLFVAFLLSTPYKITHQKKHYEKMKKIKKIIVYCNILFFYINMFMRGDDPPRKENQKMKTRERDLLNNIGKPQMAAKEELTKQDLKEIYNTIKEFDIYYLQGWKESETRKGIIELLNNYCVLYRCYSLLIVE